MFWSFHLEIWLRTADYGEAEGWSEFGEAWHVGEARQRSDALHDSLAELAYARSRRGEMGTLKALKVLLRC